MKWCESVTEWHLSLRLYWCVSGEWRYLLKNWLVWLAIEDTYDNEEDEEDKDKWYRLKLSKSERGDSSWHLRLWRCLTPFTTFPDERLQLELDKIEDLNRAIAERSKGEDLAIAELLEPLLKNQRARDYADLLQPPFVQKPLLNNDWAGLAEKVWSKFEIIFFFWWSFDSSPRRTTWKRTWTKRTQKQFGRFASKPSKLLQLKMLHHNIFSVLTQHMALHFISSFAQSYFHQADQ